MGLGLYIHIPFCRQKCAYCDFYSLAGRRERMEDYRRALEAHLAEAAPQAAHFSVDTVYFGGGTPSFFGVENLAALLKGIKKKYPVSRDAEITLEANPDSVEPKSLKQLRRAGFNRLSLGMQSADNGQLAALGRPHTFEQTHLAVLSARRAGFENLSLDLMYGLPGQDMASWQDTVEQALALAPQHLSAYGLKVEPGTPLARQVEQGEALPDDDEQAAFYLWAVRHLEQAGFEQYEISNFARPGLASRHNLKYWLLEPYMGFGPGAHSDFGGHRYSYIRDLEGYIQGVLQGGRLVDEDDPIPDRERSSEYLMLGLRTAGGIDLNHYQREYRMRAAPIVARLEDFRAQGWAAEREGRWRLTPEGFLLSNQIIGQLLELQQPVTLESTLSALRAGEAEA
ncbi:MAG: radical SAM family heme chaperone HemW [Oscillospiraceae bacterium]|nr:radical SAM family heme chaperone HemW [Oscillospiraceae bacterium]